VQHALHFGPRLHVIPRCPRTVGLRAGKAFKHLDDLRDLGKSRTSGGGCIGPACELHGPRPTGERAYPIDKDGGRTGERQSGSVSARRHQRESNRLATEAYRGQRLVHATPCTRCMRATVDVQDFYPLGPMLKPRHTQGRGTGRKRRLVEVVAQDL